jgi:hypothetical protein
MFVAWTSFSSEACSTVTGILMHRMIIDHHPPLSLQIALQNLILTVETADKPNQSGVAMFVSACKIQISTILVLKPQVALQAGKPALVSVVSIDTFPPLFQ